MGEYVVEITEQGTDNNLGFSLYDSVTEVILSPCKSGSNIFNEIDASVMLLLSLRSNKQYNVDCGEYYGRFRDWLEHNNPQLRKALLQDDICKASELVDGEMDCDIEKVSKFLLQKVEEFEQIHGKITVDV